MAIEIRDQYDKIYRYCYHKVKNAVLAEDLTQETFLRFFSQTSYSEIGKQLPYLYTIARNLCTDHFRLRTFDREKELPEDALEDVAQHRMIQQTELTLVIRQALHVLPEDEQELLLLRYVNDLRSANSPKLPDCPVLQSIERQRLRWNI